MNSVHDMVTARRERLKQELRAEILAAARDLFIKEGYAAVSIRKIADEVGCAPGTIYLYFEDKDAILGAICVETFAKLDKRMEAIASDAGDPLERLRRAGRTYIQFGLDHQDHYYVTFGIAGFRGFQADGHPYALHAGLTSFDCLRRNVQAAIDAGALRLNDTEAVAQSLWLAMHGLVMALITKKEFPFVEQSRLMECVLDIAIEGIRKR